MSDQGGRIAPGDRLQFAHELFDRNAEEIYHYVLAWTGEQASAVDLTTTVLRTAVARMDQLVEDADTSELEMRLVALVRAAVTRWRARGSAEHRVPTAVPEESMPLFDGLGELDDDQREVLILCQLLGQEPERAGRLLGSDRSAVEELLRDASESLWRVLNDASADQAVSTWERLTVGTALRQSAARWLFSADEPVLAYLSERLFGEAPVGVPAKAPARRAATAKPTVAAPKAEPLRTKVATAARPAAAAAKARADGEGSGDLAARAGGSPGKDAVVEREEQRPAWLQGGVAALVLLLRRRWTAWGIAALAAAGLGVVAALTIGGPVNGSSQCGGRLPCLPTTTAASGNLGLLVPAPTGASGNNLSTSTGVGALDPNPGFPLLTGTSSSTTMGLGGLPSTTRGGPPTTARPPKTTKPPTTPPTTAPSTTTQPPPTTAPPTTAPTTTTASPA